MKNTSEKIETIEELLGYARAFERDAALRYAELADQMEVHNNPDLAGMFRKMSLVEQLHVDAVNDLCAEVGVPEENMPKPRWSGLQSGEAPDFSEMHYMSLPSQMIKLAMRFEKENAEFYGKLAKTSSDKKIQEAALRLQKEEEMHLRELEAWLKRYPDPDSNWDEDMDPPMELE